MLTWPLAGDWTSTVHPSTAISFPDMRASGLLLGAQTVEASILVGDAKETAQIFLGNFDEAGNGHHAPQNRVVALIHHGAEIGVVTDTDTSLAQPLGQILV